MSVLTTSAESSRKPRPTVQPGAEAMLSRHSLCYIAQQSLVAQWWKGEFSPVRSRKLNERHHVSRAPIGSRLQVTQNLGPPVVDCRYCGDEWMFLHIRSVRVSDTLISRVPGPVIAWSTVKRPNGPNQTFIATGNLGGPKCKMHRHSDVFRVCRIPIIPCSIVPLGHRALR